jgi:hypothetical protein
MASAPVRGAYCQVPNPVIQLHRSTSIKTVANIRGGGGGPMIERLRLLVLAATLACISSVLAMGQIDTPVIPPDRDSGELYQRAAASRFVVIGSVSSCEGVSERITPELEAKVLKEGDLGLVRSATLCTVRVESTLCDRAYFDVGVSRVHPRPVDTLYVFVPRDEPQFTNGRMRETLAPARRYMLFLAEPPRETLDLWLKTYLLDPTHPYYRGEQMSRGVVPLPASTEAAKQPAIANQMTQLCTALRPPTLQGKLDALKQLATSKDAVLKEQAEIAQKTLQERLQHPK